MVHAETRSSTWRFLDVAREIAIILGTLKIVSLIWGIGWMLAVIAALPIYAVVMNLVGFLTLPLYWYCTPEYRTASPFESAKRDARQ